MIQHNTLQNTDDKIIGKEQSVMYFTSVTFDYSCTNSELRLSHLLFESEVQSPSLKDLGVFGWLTQYTRPPFIVSVNLKCKRAT